MGLRARKAYIAELEKSSEHGEVPTPEILAAAKDRIDAARLLVSVSNAYIENRLIMLMESGMAWGCGVETMAVTAKAGTGIILAINPRFVMDRLDGPNATLNTAFGLVHEPMHLVNHHLHVGYSGPAWDLATEVRVNHVTMELLKCGMPEVYVTVDGVAQFECKACKVKHLETDLPAGNTTDCPACSASGTLARSTEEFGVNPRKIWEKCRDDLKKQGKDTPSYDEFVATDLGCMAWLSKMTKLPTPPRRKGSGGKGSSGPSQWPCEHHGDGDKLPLDQDEVDSVAEEVLDTVFRKATVEQDPRAKEALQRVHQGSTGSENADKVWGLMGIGALYGEPVQRRSVKFWEQWLKRQIGSKLVPGRRLVYNKRLAAVDSQLKRDPVLAYRGKTRRRTGYVFADTSGSMAHEQLEFVRARFGEEANLDIEYYCVDVEIYPMQWGEPMRGGGGTNFQCIDDFLRGRLEVDGKRCSRYDFAFIFTDGEVDRLVPGGDPRKVVWLVTPGGTPWMSTHDPAMPCFLLPPV